MGNVGACAVVWPGGARYGEELWGEWWEGV